MVQIFFIYYDNLKIILTSVGGINYLKNPKKRSFKRLAFERSNNVRITKTFQLDMYFIFQIPLQ